MTGFVDSLDVQNFHCVCMCTAPRVQVQVRNLMIWDLQNLLLVVGAPLVCSWIFNSLIQTRMVRTLSLGASVSSMQSKRSFTLIYRVFSVAVFLSHLRTSFDGRPLYICISLCAIPLARRWCVSVHNRTIDHSALRIHQENWLKDVPHGLLTVLRLMRLELLAWFVLWRLHWLLNNGWSDELSVVSWGRLFDSFFFLYAFKALGFEMVVLL